jgi:steroid delta-isomerase-like uncharacterized protein
VSEENKTLVQRFVEKAFDKGNLDVADEVYASGFVSHESGGSVERDPAYVKQFVGRYRGAFPNGHATAEDVISEGDRVVYRWTLRGTHRGEHMGIPLTEGQVRIVGITLDRVSGGKIEEEWNTFDKPGMLRQLGVAPGQ